jgi:multidrug efflux pump
MSYIDSAISRTRTTMSLMAVVVVCGMLARAALPIANDPHIELPFFVVILVHEGISPEDSERLLVKPMETELRKIEGVEEVTSTASEGSGTIFVEFDASFDLDKALIDVREAVDRGKAEIPSTAEEPVVREVDSDDFPVIQINLLSDYVSEREIYQSALHLRDELEAIPAVLGADLQGHREELLEVLIDPDALHAYRISSEELINTLRRNNRLIPAGSIDTGQGRFSVKVPAVVESAEDLKKLPIRSAGDIVVLLQDVASIRRTFKDRTSYARFNGRETISISVKKRTNANVVDTAKLVRAVVEQSQPQIASGIEVAISQDQSEFAQLQVTELQGNVLTALALVMVIVVATMGFRSGVIVGLGIPVSLLFSVIIIYQLGYTFNMMVMFGMLLGLGMLIDGAIVVTEYADRRMAEGDEHTLAYSAAVKRMFWPVTASTATTLAAFLPLIFWPGVSGQFMSYLPVTVFTVLLGSLIYALLFGPVLGAIFGRPSAHSDVSAQTVHQLETGDPTHLRNVTGRYARFLDLVCSHPFIAIGIIITLLFTIFWAYGKYGVGTVFFNNAEAQYIQVSVKGRGNFSADAINELVLEVEQEVLKIPGILSMNSRTMLPGNNTSASMFGGSSSASSDRIGSIFLELHPEADRDIGSREIERTIRESTAHLAGVQVEVSPDEMGPPVGKPIQIELSSAQRELLEPTMAHLRTYLDSLPELIYIDDTANLPSIEWRIGVDRAQAAIYQSDVSSAGIGVQLVTNGVKIAEYRPDGADDAVDIRVRYPRHERGIRAMDELRISTSAGMVPLSNFAKMTPAPGVDQFTRFNGVPIETVRADVIEGVYADAMVERISHWIDEQDFNPAVRIRFRGANEEQANSAAFVQVAFLLSLALMFILLVTQFNSFYQSTLILLAVIMSTAGVLLGLLVLSNPFSSILSGVGIVALAGIVVNNNIVLIDTFNHVRKLHPELDTKSVVVRATSQRLRPVMLTTVTTVFGLLPLACGLSVDLLNRSVTAGGQMADYWAPLSQAIVFGLSFATILTLIATPAMLVIPDALRELLARRWPKSRKVEA